MLLRSSILSKHQFRHAFTTRSSGDLDLLAQGVGFDRARLFQTKQVHGRTVVAADQDPAELLKIEADGIVGAREGDAVSVRTADCVPILLAATDTGRVAAVHAGWRGVENRILAVALERLASKSVVAAIGPSIGPCCFEVGTDVADRLGFVVRREGEKAFVDLRAAVRAQLGECAAVEDVPGCTRCEPERFFSYRRDGAGGGRLIAVIVARA